MGSGEPGPNGANVPRTVTSVTNLEIGLATTQRLLMVGKIALPMVRLIPNLECATTTKVAQVRYYKGE